MGGQVPLWLSYGSRRWDRPWGNMWGSGREGEDRGDGERRQQSGLPTTPGPPALLSVFLSKLSSKLTPVLPLSAHRPHEGDAYSDFLPQLCQGDGGRF